MSAVRIDDWRLVFVFDPVVSDRDVIKFVFLAGRIDRHPVLGAPQGSASEFRIETSAVDKFDGATITTANTVYKLGKPSQEYLTLLQRRHLSWNSRCPVPTCFHPGHDAAAA